MTSRSWLRAATLPTVSLAFVGVCVAQEQPLGCDASAVGLRLVASIDATAIPPETCVIPGQRVTLRTAPFVPMNPGNDCAIIFCDVIGGQLSVTFPNWVDALPPGSLRPDQFVPVAGYDGLPSIPRFGNGETMCGDNAADPIVLFLAPAEYLVDAAHVDDEGTLRFRADYGQTAYLIIVGQPQESGTVLSGDPNDVNASITEALPLCLPAINIEKIPDVDEICAGEPTLVTYTYEVTNVSTGPAGLEPASLANVLLEDDLCGPIDGPAGDDGDDRLEAGEVWTYTCQTEIAETTTNTVTVSAEAVALFPQPGAVVPGVFYTDTATATVTAVGAACAIDGPVSVCIDRSATFCGPPGQLAYQWSASGSCVIDGATDGQCVDVDFGDAGSCVISLVIESPDGCTGECERGVPVVDCNTPGGCSEKGSLLVWSKVELRWNQAGELVQDTFISLVNDFPQDVQVLLYFINGDPQTPTEPGWNWIDNGLELTKNEPCYWSVFTGEPKGVSPFVVLDPGFPPGRPCADGSGDRCLRGYIVGWAVNAAGEEIKWNHLAGTATFVNYRDHYAWEYNACAFRATSPGLPDGAALGTPGVLMLDGTEFAPLQDILIMDFYAAGSTPFAPGGGPGEIVAQTDLTLHPGDVDLRQESEGPVTTKASINVWNQNEVKFSGTHRCITCWDQTLLRDYDTPNHFLRENLQTDKGKARIDGLASQLCDVDDDPGDQEPLGDDPDDVVSVDAALLGVVARFLSFDQGMSHAASGTNLHGAGLQNAVIEYDPEGLPPSRHGPGDVLDRMIEAVGRAIGDS